MSGLTQARLKELLHYDPETGLFTWLVSVGRCRKGSLAGSVMSRGYIRIKVDGVDYLAHRLVFLFMHGEWPAQEVDHKNGEVTDNRYANLRHASSSQNKMNTRPRGRLGVKGVSVAVGGRYQAQIKISGVTKPLGLYDSVEEAHAAYVRAANDNFGVFARVA